MASCPGAGCSQQAKPLFPASGGTSKGWHREDVVTDLCNWFCGLTTLQRMQVLAVEDVTWVRLFSVLHRKEVRKRPSKQQTHLPSSGPGSLRSSSPGSLNKPYVLRIYQKLLKQAKQKAGNSSPAAAPAPAAASSGANKGASSSVNNPDGADPVEAHHEALLSNLEGSMLGAAGAWKARLGHSPSCRGYTSATTGAGSGPEADVQGLAAAAVGEKGRKMVECEDVLRSGVRICSVGGHSMDALILAMEMLHHPWELLELLRACGCESSHSQRPCNSGCGDGNSNSNSSSADGCCSGFLAEPVEESSIKELAVSSQGIGLADTPWLSSRYPTSLATLLVSRLEMQLWVSYWHHCSSESFLAHAQTSSSSTTHTATPQQASLRALLDQEGKLKAYWLSLSPDKQLAILDGLPMAQKLVAARHADGKPSDGLVQLLLAAPVSWVYKDDGQAVREAAKHLQSACADSYAEQLLASEMLDHREAGQAAGSQGQAKKSSGSKKGKKGKKKKKTAAAAAAAQKVEAEGTEAVRGGKQGCSASSVSSDADVAASGVGGVGVGQEEGGANRLRNSAADKAVSCRENDVGRAIDNSSSGVGNSTTADGDEEGWGQVVSKKRRHKARVHDCEDGKCCKPDDTKKTKGHSERGGKGRRGAAPSHPTSGASLSSAEAPSRGQEGQGNAANAAAPSNEFVARAAAAATPPSPSLPAASAGLSALRVPAAKAAASGDSATPSFAAILKQNMLVSAEASENETGAKSLQAHRSEPLNATPCWSSCASEADSAGPEPPTPAPAAKPLPWSTGNAASELRAAHGISSPAAAAATAAVPPPPPPPPPPQDTLGVHDAREPVDAAPSTPRRKSRDSSLCDSNDGCPIKDCPPGCLAPLVFDQGQPGNSRATSPNTTRDEGSTLGYGEGPSTALSSPTTTHDGTSSTYSAGSSAGGGVTPYTDRGAGGGESYGSRRNQHEHGRDRDDSGRSYQGTDGRKMGRNDFGYAEGHYNRHTFPDGDGNRMQHLQERDRIRNAGPPGPIMHPQPRINGAWQSEEGAALRLKAVEAAKEAMITVLDKDIALFMSRLEKAMKPRQEVWRKLVARVEGLVKKIWPDAKVEIYGSCRTGVELPSSDVDLVVTGINGNDCCYAPQASGGNKYCSAEETVRHLKMLADAFEAPSWVKGMKVIETAAVPVIKVLAAVPGPLNGRTGGNGNQRRPRDSDGAWLGGGNGMDHVPLDISFASPLHGGVASTNWVNKFMKDGKFAFCLPTVLVLKELLGQRGLNHPWSGGLSSYSLINMVFTVLHQVELSRVRDRKLQERAALRREQQQGDGKHELLQGVEPEDFKLDPAALGITEKDLEEEDISDITPAELLVKFLVFFGRQFDALHHGISLGRGTLNSPFLLEHK
ncbi:unnamed protein product, partial [Chrysoparadoxa australica]